MVAAATRRVVQRVLNGALGVEARSVLAYALQVSAALEDDLPDAVREGLVHLRSQLGEHASQLANRILAAGGTPDPGNFPLVATNFNFLKVRHLLEQVEPTIPGDAARLAELAKALPEPADVHDLIAGYAKDKRAQHATVQDLLAKLTPAPAAPPAPAAEAEAKAE